MMRQPLKGLWMFLAGICFSVAAAAQESSDFLDEFIGTDLNPAFRLINPDRQYTAMLGDALLLVSHQDFKNVVEYNGALPEDYAVSIRVSDPPSNDGQTLSLRVGDGSNNVRVGMFDRQYVDLTFFTNKTLADADARPIEVEDAEMLGKPVYLKLEKIGPVFQGFYSADGSKWIDLGKQALVMPEAKVSIVTGNFEPAPEAPIQIDSFEIRELLR